MALSNMHALCHADKYLVVQLNVDNALFLAFSIEFFKFFQFITAYSMVKDTVPHIFQNWHSFASFINRMIKMIKVKSILTSKIKWTKINIDSTYLFIQLENQKTNSIYNSKSETKTRIHKIILHVSGSRNLAYNICI